jgi:hypothetical protein
MSQTTKRWIRRTTITLALVITGCAWAPAAGGLSVSLSWLAPDAALANPYTVYVCEGGTGPNGLGFDNAMGFSTNSGVHIAHSGCGSSGIGAWSVNGNATGSEAGGFWFQAPAYTSITNLAFAGYFSAWDGWVSHWATNGNGSGDPVPASWGVDCQSSSCNNLTGYTSVGVNNASTWGSGSGVTPRNARPTIPIRFSARPARRTSGTARSL